MDTNRETLIEKLKERHIYYKDTFSTPCGKKVINDLETSCFINKSTIQDQSSVDPYQIAFKEGQRSVVLKIRNLVSDEQLKKIGIDDDRKQESKTT